MAGDGAVVVVGGSSGIGRELVFSVSNNDYPMAQASFLLIALVVLVANLVVDIIYAYLDPRIRY